MSNYVKGEYKRNIYDSGNGYLVGLFKVKETNIEDESIINKTITFTGYFHELNEIDTYIFHGEFIEHDKYGKQFQVESYERVKPEEKDSIVAFLTSGHFSGIGEKKAEKIVKVLGEKTLDIILNTPDNLLLIPGITKRNVDELHRGLKEYERSYDTIIKLGNIGFSTRESMAIYNHYKEKTLEIIGENIYDIYSKIDGISFKRIDSIALKNNTPKDDLIRVKAVILYIITELINTLGHSAFYKKELIPYINKVLGIKLESSKIDIALEELLNQKELVLLDDLYYLKDMYEAETNIVKRINILVHKKDNEVKNIDEKIKELEKYFEIDYNTDQELAIKESSTKNFLIITGGPGTGKTTILKGICELYRMANKIKPFELNDRITLLAPTGRAAKRMSEKTGLKASTIHRFLKWNKDTNKFQVNEYNKSKTEFVLIDEASMIDVYLFSSLLKGLKADTKIVLVGDVDQLPSVGPGTVLEDLIESEKVPVIRLNSLYRQKEGSNITFLAYSIKDGMYEKELFNKDVDLTFIECKNKDVIEQVKELASNYSDYSYKDFQILAPMYKTINGIDKINDVITDVFNKKSKTKKELKVGDVVYRENDKVIQLTNMPEDNVYNGDVGIIEKISAGAKKEIYIDFDGNVVKYTPSNFLNFKKAYAISIHKSQGSEFDIVIIPLVKDFNKMLYRKLIYTAVTRCKKRLFIVGETEALKFAISNKNSNLRRTTIKKFLIEGINPES